MPNKGTSINIDLLKPQGNQEKIYIKLTKWLFSTGRYIIIGVELIVLIAFVSRFKFDADLASNKEAIEQQIPFIESQKTDELLIRQTQLQLTTIKDIRHSSADFVSILEKIAAQTPLNVKITTINLESDNGKINLRINGQSPDSNLLTAFVAALKADRAFSEINLASISLDLGVTTFNITGAINSSSQLKL